MVATTVLVPFATSIGTGNLDDLEAGLIYDTPPTFGGGSVVDDLDSTYVELGSYRDVTDGQHIETIVADFTVEPGVTPIAALAHIRARNSADVVADPPEATRLLYIRLSSTATDASFSSLALGNVASSAWWGGPLTESGVTSPEWFTGWWQSHPDMGNPSDAGDWYDLTSDTSAKDALMGDGLRLTFGWLWLGDETFSRRAWLDVFEVRLLIAYTAVGMRRRPLRQFPRSDGLGMSSARRQDANRSMQASLRRGGGVYF